MRILFLYAEMVPSWVPTFEALVRNYGSTIDVIHWDHKKKTPYVPDSQQGVSYHNRSEFNLDTLIDFVLSIDPDVIFISGWMDKDYLKAVWYFNRRYPVVTGLDDWYVGSFRQRVASFIPSYIRRRLFSHAWIPGPRQYEFAKNTGFRDDEIIFNLLSCDTSNFSQSGEKSLASRSKRFVYAGRFSPEKGTSLLADAFRYYRNALRGQWDLTCIGSGPLEYCLRDIDGLNLVDFCDAKSLACIFGDARAFIIPSIRDFFPLVVHEATSSGLPVIWSSRAGSADVFCLNNFNGFKFDAESYRSLAHTMARFEQLSESRLIQFSENSTILSKRISPEICAASLVSVVNGT